MPSIDIDRYTQPFWFSYSLPKRFDAEAAQVQRAVLDAAAAKEAAAEAQQKTEETSQLLAAGMTPADILFMRTGTGTKAGKQATADEIDVQAAGRTAEAYARHYGYHPYSDATQPELARAYKDNLARLSQHVMDNRLTRLDQPTVDSIMGGEKMKVPATKGETRWTREQVARKSQALLDYYGMGLNRYQQLNPRMQADWDANRAYLNQYMLAINEEPDEATVRSIMGGGRPEIPQAKAAEAPAEEGGEPGVTEPGAAAKPPQPPPRSTAEALVQGVERGEVKTVPGEVEVKPGESEEELGRRRKLARKAAIEQAATEARGVTITVPVPGSTKGETTSLKLRGGLALAASKLLPEQVQEYGELLYALQQEGADPALIQQLTNILARPEDAQHLLRIIRDDRARREAKAKPAAKPGA